MITHLGTNEGQLQPTPGTQSPASFTRHNSRGALLDAWNAGMQAAQSRHAEEREALVRKCARYEELIREVIATDEAAVKELEAMNLGGVAEPTLTAKLRHALFDSGSQG